MMKIKIIRNTVVNKEPVFEGQIVECQDQEAKYLISLGKAVAIENKTAPKIETADAEPAAETADIKTPKKKG